MSDSRELAEQHGGGEVMSAAPRAMSIPAEQRLAMMREAMTNPDVDPDKARAMLELMREMENDERKAEFNRDKIAAKAAMPAIFKRGFNSHQKTSYVKFEDLQRAVDPILHKFNLMLEFDVESDTREIRVTPILRHSNGWTERGSSLGGGPDTGPGRTPIQAIGSAVSYLKRYTAEAMLNLTRDGEDNDGALREGSLLNDRQSGLVVDAQQWADDGRYTEEFGKLSAKDKAVLIRSGYHARLGGAPALPDQRAKQDREPPREERREEAPREEAPADPPPTLSEAGNDLATPEGWTAEYELDCANAPDLAALMEVQRKGAKAIKKLETGHPALYQLAIDAGTKAATRLAEPDPGTGGNEAAGKNDLFGGDAK